MSFNSDIKLKRINKYQQENLDFIDTNENRMLISDYPKQYIKKTFITPSENDNKQYQKLWNKTRQMWA